MIGFRRTRRRIANVLLGVFIGNMIWMWLPGDIEPNEMALAMVVIPSVVGGLIAFMIGEAVSDHSHRKHGNDS